VAVRRQMVNYSVVPLTAVGTSHFTDLWVGFTLSRATKALRESRGIALLYF